MEGMEVLNQVIDALLPSVIIILTTVMSYLAAKLKNKYDEKINTDIKKSVVEETVKYVQQVWGTLGGPEKLQKAIEQASLLLNEKGITISETELNMLIESSVYGIKSGFTNDVKITEEANANEKSEG